MREHRAAAITAGLLYITGTVAGFVSAVVVSAPVRDARDPLGYAVEHSDTVVTAGLLTLVMGLSLAFIPMMRSDSKMWPSLANSIHALGAHAPYVVSGEGNRRGDRVARDA